ncbi:MAG: DUF1749 domain-containing protein [Candidatus Gastranaerophilales bacterium]|nr:DUF1749 domain-containing protein [Candidatus Gastranaerophilales bacterium]
MKIIKVNTKRGLELKGAIFDAQGTDTVLVMLTGICSNIFQNELLYSTGKLLQENGIATIIGHAHDSFSCFAYTDFSTRKQKISGTFDDNFEMVYEDVEAYVKYAKELGFKNIILGGHSLGSNKIIHYLGNTKDDFIDYFIISSPVDIIHWWNVMPDVEKCFELAQKWVKEGRGDDILPFLFGGFSPMKAKTVLGFYNADNLKNCPVLSKRGETESLYNMKPNGSFIIGSKDSVTGDSPKGFMEQLNLWTAHSERNRVIEVKDASHIFYGMHDIYAKTVLDCIQNHFKGA